MSSVCFQNIKITLPKSNSSKFKGSGTVLFGGCVEVRFSIFDGPKGIFAGLPSQKGQKPDAEGKIPWYPLVKILDKEQYIAFQKAVVAEYNKTAKLAGNENSGEESQDFQNDNIPF